MYKTLLVDDRKISILELKRLGVWGSASGFEVAGKAADGAEALKLLRLNPYDLVITDIRMPRLDGICLLQEIKKEGLCLCVVLLSEYSEFEYARSGLVLGAFDYLVKPVEEESMKKLLSRARQFLDGAEKQTQRLPKTLADEDQNRYFYPIAEEKNILACIGVQNDRIPALFCDAAQSAEQLLQPGAPLLSGIVRKLYQNIVSSVFEKYAWLARYTPIERYGKPDPWSHGEENELDAYRNALSDLLGYVGSLLPGGMNNTLQEICSFILENPESEISLSFISEKFFINHTYLSNLFRQKTGLRFNQYVTLVRMSRARYLLEHSDLKICEISSCLGYRDSDYFNRLFKKYSGKTPTDCRRASGYVK
jgi:two-component system response regulator YesN